ncbi:hypothetical protein F5Y01DRAFT_40380 [Xylaria sp. FL0043]|nr:hypothetical protein F5Y01DRAFT_40380 [Xylaria sp. FL0043]
MTSKLPESLFADIGDLRQKYEKDEMAQSFALSRTYPPQFSNEEAVGAPSYKRGSEHLFKFNLNFDAAVVVVRHLYSVIGLQHRQSEAMTTEEQNHPILRLIWADFEDESGAAALSILRHEMQVRDDPKGTMTVFQLFEQPAMWKSLWAKPPFQLFHPTLLGKLRGATEWQIIKHHADIEEESLVEWDGTDTLGAYISTLFGQTIDPETGSEFVESFNYSAIIRVRYKHTTSSRPPATYQDLRRIQIAPRRLKRDSNNPNVMVRAAAAQDDERVAYTLIAVVRCADPGTESDRIRLYNVVGQPLSLPISLHAYVGTRWNIGDATDPNRVYLLFYAQTPLDPISGQNEEPIARTELNTGRLIDAMKGSLLPAHQPTGEGSSG